MYGFALSPDGARLAYGSQDEGVFVGSSDASGAFEHVSAIKTRGLTWSAAGLYACATEPVDPFAVGLSMAADTSFKAVYQLQGTCPQSCPDESPFNRTCRASWTESTSGVAKLTGATGEACSVSWARTSNAGDAGLEASDAAADAGTMPKSVEASGGCSCELGARRSTPASSASQAVLVAALAVYFSRAGRRAAAPVTPIRRSRGRSRRS
jgi:hypothetical protein